MKDVETVVRFFAMRFLDSFDMPLKNFLDSVTEKCNSLDKSVLNQYEELFNDTIKLAYDIFGEKAFGMWKIREEELEYSSTSNLFLFDPMMLVLSSMLDKKEQLINAKQLIDDGIQQLQQKYSILNEGRKNTKADIKQRVEIFHEYFNSFIQC
jgi:hypothetical protein